jgi:hypothetical protein
MGGEERCIDLLEGRGVDGRIILKHTPKKYDRKPWAVFIWPRIGSELRYFIKYGGFMAG